MFCADDISEAYRQMRRLVMDYLGVSATTPASTAAPYTITDTREATEAFPTPFATVPGVVGVGSGGVGGVGGVGGPASSNQMGARTWSKPSIPDSLSQRGTTRVGSGAPVSRGIVVSIKGVWDDIGFPVQNPFPGNVMEGAQNYPLHSGNVVSNRKSVHLPE